MRNIVLSAITVLILSIAGFYALNAYIYNEKQDMHTNEQGEVTEVPKTGPVTLTGTVSFVDFDAQPVDGPVRITLVTGAGTEYIVAIPSMGRNTCQASEITDPENITNGDMVDVFGNRNEQGEIVPCDDSAHYLRATRVVNDVGLGVTFTYKKGPNGYLLYIDPRVMSTDPHFVRGYELILGTDYRALMASDEPREGPPVIQLRAYRNPERLDPQVWVNRNSIESNIELAFSEPVERIIGGADAIFYTSDGLYGTDTYVVAHGSYIYLFTGGFIDDNSPQRADLKALIETLRFDVEK